MTKTRPGIWEPVITVKPYSGEVLKNSRSLSPTSTLNDNIKLSNAISIVADPYAYGNFYAMRYIKWMGVSWKITNIDVQRPRLTLTIGGVYNGN